MRACRGSIIALAALLLSALLISCSGSAGSGDTGGGEGKNDKITVIATIFPHYDFVRQIAGDRVELRMLLAPESESHTFTPSLTDIADIAKADIFIYTGGFADEWAADVSAAVSDSSVLTVAAADAVTLLDEEHFESGDGESDSHDGNDDGNDDGHDDGNDDGNDAEYDEHVWTSPENAIKIVDHILKALCEVDPENAEYYKSNAQSYKSKLAELDAELREIVSDPKRKTVVVADRFPFLYLMRAYGIEYYAALPGCSVGSEPSAKTIASLAKTVSSNEIPYVFYIEGSQGKTADLICEAAGCGKLLLHSCHTVTAKQLADGVTYLDLMKTNAQMLRTALN